MPGAWHEAFGRRLRHCQGALRLRLTTQIGSFYVVCRMDDAHIRRPRASALDHHCSIRARLIEEAMRLLKGRRPRQSLVSTGTRQAFAQFPSRRFVAKEVQMFRPRTDEDQPAPFARRAKAGTFAQESVAGMDRTTTGSIAIL